MWRLSEEAQQGGDVQLMKSLVSETLTKTRDTHKSKCIVSETLTKTDTH